ncbi:MAG TPA: hypothetical protein VL172_03245, partial [Kofleriaceae bacterium]|nr:hypothetical protein [Kofleriaceae bacterium]
MDETFSSSDYDPTNVNALLAKTCKAVPSCLQAYADRAWALQQMVEDMNILAEEQRVADQIAPWVVMDTRKTYSNQQVATYQQGVRYFLIHRRDTFGMYLPPASP